MGSSPTAGKLVAEVDSMRRQSVSSQANYETAVFGKTSRTNARGEGVLSVATVASCLSGPGLSTDLVHVPFTAEIIMFDDHLVVYKNLGDLMFYVTGSQEENELILYSVLQAFYESVSILLR